MVNPTIRKTRKNPKKRIIHNVITFNSHLNNIEASFKTNLNGCRKKVRKGYGETNEYAKTESLRGGYHRTLKNLKICGSQLGLPYGSCHHSRFKEIKRQTTKMIYCLHCTKGGIEDKFVKVGRTYSIDGRFNQYNREGHKILGRISYWIVG